MNVIKIKNKLLIGGAATLFVITVCLLGNCLTMYYKEQDPKNFASIKSTTTYSKN